MRKIYVLLVLIGLAIVCGACLGQPTAAPSNTTTVIPITTGDSSGMWGVLITVLFFVAVGLVAWAMNERSKRQAAQKDTNHLLEQLMAQRALPMRNGRPYVYGDREHMAGWETTTPPMLTRGER